MFFSSPLIFFSLQMHHPVSPAKEKKTPAAAMNHNLPALSTVNINAGQQLLQGLQLLIGLLNGAVCLHVAGDVVADVVHQGDRVGLMSLLQRRGILFDDFGKLGLLHQLWQTGMTGTKVWICPEWVGVGGGGGGLSMADQYIQIIKLSPELLYCENWDLSHVADKHNNNKYYTTASEVSVEFDYICTSSPLSVQKRSLWSSDDWISKTLSCYLDKNKADSSTAQRLIPTRSIILAMNSVHWSSSRERRKSLAVFHMHRTLSSHMVLPSVFPHRRFSPGSRYMSATHSTSKTFSVVSWTWRATGQVSNNDVNSRIITFILWGVVCALKDSGVASLFFLKALKKSILLAIFQAIKNL